MSYKRYVLSATVLIGVLAPLARSSEESLPKGDAVMDRYVEVTGGKVAYEKRRSEVATIQVEILGRGIKGTVTRYTDSSNNEFSTGEIEGAGKMEDGVYNGQAWENTAIMGPRLKTGTENADAVLDSYFNAAVAWRKLYKAETVSVEQVNGEECYKVRLTPLAEGTPQFDYMSRKTGLMVKTERTAVTPMGEVKVEASASDYKPFAGILYPVKTVQNMMGNQIAMTLLSLKANVDIPKERFEPPAEVKKLMAK